MIRPFRVPALSASAIAVIFWTGIASAAPNDADALKLRERAIYTDYLATSFAEAEAKLAQALTLCAAPSACASTVVARIQCDLGAVLFSDQKADEAQAHFSLAFKQDPNVAIDDDLASPEMDRVFMAAKGVGEPPSASHADAAPQASEDITHAPPPAQAVLTPVPLYAEVPEGVSAVKVIARYKAFGMEKWKTAVLRKVGSGWGGEIPCADVGDSTGDLKYFIQATDENGDLVAASGRLVAPHVVHIVAQLAGEPPHLPGGKPPAQCTQKSDCPPGFPGCDDGSDKKVCSSSDDCAEDQACQDGACVVGDDASGEGPVPLKRNWVSLGLQADVLAVPSATDACAGGTGYTCFDSHGSYYSAVPLAGADDAVTGGPAIATLRVLAGYDRVLGERVMLGGRLGFAFNGGPQRPGASSFMPLHAEARASLWFGHEPLSRTGFRFFALLAGGAAEVDAGVQVDVYASAQAYRMGQSQNYTAWKKTGLGFAAEGLGTMYAFTPSSGVVLEVKALEMFPTTALGAAVQLGYMIGL
jgi:hypothetical protein